MSVKDLRRIVDSALADIFGPDLVLAFHTFALPKTPGNALGVPKNGSCFGEEGKFRMNPPPARFGTPVIRESFNTFIIP
ncbi:hypothetical protein SUGI_0283790 [Cryptomeria japonica]|nr:hypothetical protein SUGI_0283790 [Cryptomeria japonica]